MRLAVVLVFIGCIGAAQAQQDVASIAAGPFVAVPARWSNVSNNYLKLGGGLVIIGQYNLSNRSALLLQPGLAVYGTKPSLDYTGRSIFISSLYGGYKYSFGSAGYFLNGLAGFSSYSVHHISSTDFVLGGGKRFIIKDASFIDAGVDFVFGDTDNRFNIKVAFSLLRRPKVK